MFELWEHRPTQFLRRNRKIFISTMLQAYSLLHQYYKTQKFWKSLIRKISSKKLINNPMAKKFDTIKIEKWHSCRRRYHRNAFDKRRLLEMWSVSARASMQVKITNWSHHRVNIYRPIVSTLKKMLNFELRVWIKNNGFVLFWNFYDWYFTFFSLNLALQYIEVRTLH